MFADVRVPETILQHFSGKWLTKFSFTVAIGAPATPAVSVPTCDEKNAKMLQGKKRGLAKAGAEAETAPPVQQHLFLNTSFCDPERKFVNHVP